MFRNPHVSMMEQLFNLMTGETWLADTDFVNCQIKLQGAELQVRTPDDRCFEIKICQLQNGDVPHEK